MMMSALPHDEESAGRLASWQPVHCNTLYTFAQQTAANRVDEQQLSFALRPCGSTPTPTALLWLLQARCRPAHGLMRAFVAVQSV